MEMDSPASSYYPPRARWYSSLWRWWYLVKVRLYLDRLPKIEQRELYRVLLGAALPGWALVWTRRPIVGILLGTTYCLAAAVFLIWVGYPISNFALTVMISIHAGSILRIQQSVGLRKRIFDSLATFLVFTVCVYMPLRYLMEQHWCMPLQTHGRLVVVRTGAQHTRIHRGDWIAYRIDASGHQYDQGAPVRIHGGYMLGRVLAVAEDEVRFEPGRVLVNGELEQQQAYMPKDGAIQVKEGCWFIWPELDISGHGDVGAETLSAAMVQVATVPEKTLVGVPYQRWFWRKQTLP